ncbi:MAG: response regulator [Candidatus Avelusimicrobium sp.]|uniref:response regulator n=1 Tax=Candidatus Avelusimicrobium sp. TaxID=3048833 RepID=UPI003EFE71DE
MKKLICLLLPLACCSQALYAQVKPGKALVKAVSNAPAQAAKATQAAIQTGTVLGTVARAAAKTQFSHPERIRPLPFEPGYTPDEIFDPNDIEFRLTPQTVILDRYDELFKHFEYNFKTDETFSREKALYAKEARSALLAPLPAPTDPYKLVHSYHLPPEMLEEYDVFYSYVKTFHPYLCNQLMPFLAASAPRWNPSEKRALDEDLASLSLKIQNLLRHMHNTDPLISRIITDINWAREILFDMPGQLVVPHLKRPAPFNLNEYRLVPPAGASPRLAILDDTYFFSPDKARSAAEELCAQIPAGLKIAVLNDNPAHINQYAAWQNGRLFTNGITVQTFTSVGEFMQKHNQSRFDLILTDYFIPGGGGNLLVKTLRNNRDNTPILLQSYTGEGTSAWDMTRSPQALEKDYMAGYDGELPGNDDFFSRRGYLYVLEGIRNFYLYRAAHAAQ